MDYQVRNLMFFWREYGIFLHGVSSSKSNPRYPRLLPFLSTRSEAIHSGLEKKWTFFIFCLIWLIIWKTTWLLRNKFVCWWITIKSIQRYILCISWEHRSNFEIYKKTTILHRCLRMQLYYRGNLVFFLRKWWIFLSDFLRILVWILPIISLLF